MKWIIYGYQRKDNDKIVYVGLTSNLEQRRLRHEQYNPANPKILEYQYPLSRAIRKHGLKMFYCVILEDDIESLSEAIKREKYWISFFDTYRNGYNQTHGGKAPKYIKFSPETIAKAKKLIKEKKSFNEISQVTGISVVHLSEINTGKRHFDSDEKYPLNKMTRGRKITDETIEQILYLLQNTKITQQQIAERFHTHQTIVGRINVGKMARKKELSYPIR